MTPLDAATHAARIALARNVARLRKAAGLSRKGLSERAGLNPSSVYHVEAFERGTRTSWHATSLATIARIAKALGVGPGELLTEEKKSGWQTLPAGTRAGLMCGAHCIVNCGECMKRESLWYPE